MKKINFISCGQIGDLFHQLFVIKSICLENNAKANLYIADLSYNLCVGGNFTFDLNKTYEDTKEIIKSQPYIDSYEILDESIQFESKICNCGFKDNCFTPNDTFIHLNYWRLVYAQQRKCWTNLLSDYFQFKPLQNKYLETNKIDKNVIGKILIHNSNKRHNYEFPWETILNTEKDILFISTDISEYESFRFKRESINPYIVNNLNDMVNAIGSCELFIGNQSAPLAIASALDVPRIAELHSSSYEFYVNEEKYSDNISWFVNNNYKFNSEKLKIKI